MARRKRQTLPSDFSTLLDEAPLETLIATFEHCDLEARGGYAKQTALSFYNCPDALLHWLVAQGADLEAVDKDGRTALHHRAAGWKGGVDALLALGADRHARDRRGNTPLHAAAQSHKSASLRRLVEHGASVDARNDAGMTPLKLALATASNSDIVETAEIAGVLLAAGASVQDDMRADVERIGRTFEFHRAGFNPEFLDATDAGLTTLYRLFGTAPAAARRVHDGWSPIVVDDAAWPAQFDALWQLLVPSSGAAASVQGEVIRIAGKLSREILDNGAVNWDADFRAMLAAFAAHLGSGTPLPAAALVDARALTRALHAGDGDEDALSALARLAVDWVRLNPAPIALPLPAYRR
ncbi:ankyrin repeat domain-containing protein [Xanthomonas sp. XNM01]|uniref:ankyrin repeat domain-containing protein n=1 Tax=Xanthomonas sp. XNM01 TaxID=2769289 RepID=UPI001781C463|nr:ankyrin repeat domain-containing protein [Xanthomonas sp. XNM01]MBD9369834.1 ankyrin repeat domain-containing protein [Xanthomonas sp. XNM01]